MKQFTKLLQKVLIILCICSLLINTVSPLIPISNVHAAQLPISAETETPAETEAPTETETPAETEVPTETETPAETEAPTETETPAETETPTETETPVETEAPAETETPEETKAPVKAPAKPTLKSAASSSYNSITIKWKSVSKAEGYRIYRKTGKSSWKRIAQVSKKTASYKDKSLKCGTTYYYTVRAFVKDGDSYVLSTYDKKGIKAKPVPSAPELKETVCAASSVTIKWGKVSGATKYRVYRKLEDGSYKKLADVSSKTSSYKDTTAKKDGRYVYTVKAFHNDIAGKYSKSGLEGGILVPSIFLNSISISSKGTAKVAWTKQSNADGYYIYRKKSGGDYKRVGDVSASKSSFTEKGLDSKSKFIYTVVGYRKFNDKKIKGTVNKSGIAPKLEYGGSYVRNVKKTYIGLSGAGRKMYSYTIGSGSNHLVITMAIHGWEDNWSRDGSCLVKTGEKLITYASKHTSSLKSNNYSIIIVPMANPDGLYDGTTCNGPGRCTTYRYNNSGKLVKGGVDLNSCFPTGFKASYESRYYTGAKPLMAREAVVLKKWLDSSKGSGKNVFIDAHGWYNQTITRKGDRGKLFQAFSKYFSGTRPAVLGGGDISRYAATQGYEAALFEFPHVNSASQFDSRGYADSYINSIFRIISTIR